MPADRQSPSGTGYPGLHTILVKQLTYPSLP